MTFTTRPIDLMQTFVEELIQMLPGWTSSSTVSYQPLAHGKMTAFIRQEGTSNYIKLTNSISQMEIMPTAAPDKERQVPPGVWLDNPHAVVKPHRRFRMPSVLATARLIKKEILPEIDNRCAARSAQLDAYIRVKEKSERIEDQRQVRRGKLQARFMDLPGCVGNDTFFVFGQSPHSTLTWRVGYLGLVDKMPRGGSLYLDNLTEGEIKRIVRYATRMIPRDRLPGRIT